jgi:arylsulfatase A-like enzyme
MRPNVIVVMMDTARADAFEPYGAHAGASPAVAQLAARGGSAADFYAPACWTVPSHAAMFTGRLPRSMGLCQAPGGTPHGCRPAMEAQAGSSLPATLRENGYRTAAISANPWISATSGFDIGFDDFISVSGRRVSPHQLGGRRAAVEWYVEALRARLDDGAMEAERLLQSWLADRGDAPFFWFVNLIECHSPYMPPAPYNYRNPLRRLQAAHDGRRHQSLEAVWRTCLDDGFDVSPGTLERTRHLYARSIRQMDDWLARLLQTLHTTGLLDDTLVVVTADHGENLGEGNLVGHAFSLDNRLLRVPLVYAGPVSLDTGGMLSLADFPRILTEGIDLAQDTWAEPVSRDGIVVAQLDAIGSADDPRVEQAMNDWKLSPRGRRRMTTAMTCATDGRLKLVQDGGSQYFYDLHADPGELVPLLLDAAAEAAHGPRLVALRRRLDSALDPGTVAAAVAAPEGGEAEELERQMRLLGYM